MTIAFSKVTFTYAEQSEPVLRDVSLRIDEGEFVVVVGDTGVGKSTLLQLVNGTVPNFTGGHLIGDVVINGRSIRDHQPNALADVVGVVPQDPLASFVTDVVEDELAYTMECLGLDAQTMRKRIEETIDILGLEPIRHRSIRTLSGGQQQRVAIAAVLVAHPRILVLDEPTSALDPNAADDVLSALQRLVHDVGITVIMSEHRLERVLQFADRLIAVSADGSVRIGDPRTVMADAPSVPPIVAMARTFGWTPMPLTVREARAAAAELRAAVNGQQPPLRIIDGDAKPVATLDDVTVQYGLHTALLRVSLHLRAGEICALMGRNGAGKSTLLRALAGDLTPQHGVVRVDGADPVTLRGSALPTRIGVVPQQPGDLLMAQRVSHECRDADRDSSLAPGTTRALLALLAPDIDDDAHPRDLSEGQRLSLALAIVLAPQPGLLLLDEPTRGLDYSGKRRLTEILRAAAAAGTAIMVATHDVELAAELAHTVLVLADGDVVAHDRATNILTTSPLFAPQVSKVLAPSPWLRIEDVVDAWNATSR